MRVSLRLLPAIAGLLGAAGVALAAAASHGSDTHLLGNASLMCLVHAPALIALFLLAERRKAAFFAAWFIATGTALFTLDLLSRHVRGDGLFSMAAPGGGILMIAGWLVLAIGMLLPLREKN